MNNPRDISIKDFTYDLPEDRIAHHPLPGRDASRLLIYRDGTISEDQYKNIAWHLPTGGLLVFNDTKVIRARLRLFKPSGGQVEIFCLEPNEEMAEYQSVMLRTGSLNWKCMIGGAGKWKNGSVSLEAKSAGVEFELKATVQEKLSDAYVVNFSWEPAGLSFAEVLEAAGDIPLPPYIKRETAPADSERYQTIYAKDEGSVAAPTAGLHFTEGIMNDLARKQVDKTFVTLHVGAGTFKPVKAALMAQHEMHAEWIDVQLSTIETLLERTSSDIIAVGTTSLRTLESLYWMGVKASLNMRVEDLSLGQWEVYEAPLSASGLTVATALTALLQWMRTKQLDRLFAQTQILIAPGYRFRGVRAIVTNFHQPESTLLLLVAAAIGDDWRRVYDHALQNGFRFLSYGDGSLLWIRNIDH